ncbi:Ig-like domain-containing protein [Leptospira bandrabouensis]|uniref:Ig-like domain-containing protein n=2 Tax=Leptospira bandrabouensis TaxID=2484903 RepID=UPI001EEA92EF|nr:Ig-like domain-containing protein [Leptospira bandrabouensis]MCG6146449.1 Ig-like domain-containing protein [Leptospira bandrabouensis]MCG6166036.1 Ig-like domain-containing protein [Leptospira bandrabouensis]
MMKTTIIFVFSFVLLFLGCSKIPNEGDILGLLGARIEDGFVYPKVLFVNPSSEATQVPIDSPIIIDFSKPMDRSLVESAISISAPGGNTSFTPSWVFDTRLILNFSAGLTQGKKYEINLNASSTKDKDGNRMAKNFISSFYTIGVGGAPTVAATNPPLSGELQLGWPVGSDLLVKFSQPMDPVSTNNAVTIEGASALFTPIWDSSFRELTLRLKSPLNLGATYRLRVNVNAKSALGIPLDKEYLIAFSTATTLEIPTVIADVTVSPAWGTINPDPFINTFTGASKFDNFTFNFSTPMTIKNINGEIKFSPGINGHFEWTGNQLLRFIPSSPLITGQQYRLSIGRDFTSASGVGMNQSYTIDFLVDEPTTSVNISPVQILGKSFTASPACNLIVTPIDQTINFPIDPYIAYEFRPRYTCPEQYEIELLFQTAGSARLKLTGDNNLFDAISVNYLSGGPVTSSIFIQSVDYLPSANPQRVKVRLGGISGNLARYVFKVAGGTSGLHDINENSLSNDLEFVFYGN